METGGELKKLVLLRNTESVTGRDHVRQPFSLFRASLLAHTAVEPVPLVAPTIDSAPLER